MLSVIVPVIYSLVLKIFPIPIIFVPLPILQPAFIEDLENSHVYKKSYYLPFLLYHSAPNPVFLCPTRLGPQSYLGLVRLVFGVFPYRKTAGLHFK